MASPGLTSESGKPWTSSHGEFLDFTTPLGRRGDQDINLLTHDKNFRESTVQLHYFGCTPAHTINIFFQLRGL
jgi:hypothetical protein